jgi:hypothetical protein
MRVQIGSKGSESVIAQDSKVRQGDSYYFLWGTILCKYYRSTTLPIVLPQWCRRHLFLIVHHCSCKIVGGGKSGGWRRRTGDG